MMGKSHALTGVIGGCAVVIVSPAPAFVDGLILLLMGGAALLPDIDTPTSTVAHSLGPLTVWLAKFVDRLSLWIYHSTRTQRDPPDRVSGHRLITHTPAGAAAMGAIVEVACAVSHWGVAATCFLVCGLLATMFRRWTRRAVRVVLGIKESAGLVAASIFGVTGYLVSLHNPGYWWTYGLAVFVGSWIHREGDWCTNSGCPRRSWPLVKDGRRWDKSRARRTFRTGSDTEIYVVQRLLYLATAVSLAFACGLAQVLIGLVLAVAQGQGNGG